MDDLDACIKYWFELKDPNLNFYAYGDKLVHGQVAQVYRAILTIPDKACPHCGSLEIVKHGYATVMVKGPSIDETMPSYIEIKKQRIMCHACGRTSMASTDLSNL